MKLKIRILDYFLHIKLTSIFEPFSLHADGNGIQNPHPKKGQNCCWGIEKENSVAHTSL